MYKNFTKIKLWHKRRRSKILLTMKLTTVLLIATMMQVSAVSKAQNLTIKGNLSIRQIFKEIKKQTGYDVLWPAEIVNVSQIIHADFKRSSLDKVMQTCLANKQLIYQIDEKTIVIKRKGESALQKIPGLLTHAMLINGKVKDDNGKTLPGVTVRNKTANTVTLTDVNGAYSILSNKGDVLSFSFIGYKTFEVTVGSEDTININLVIDQSNLNQVVVIGYGSIEKKDLTGSVSTIDVKTIENVPFTTIDNALAGKAAGVQVTKSDGTPGGAVRIRVRGSTSLLGGNDPLYVIDGVPVQVQSNFRTPGYDLGSPVGNDVSGYNGNSTSLSTAFVNGLNSLGGLNPDDIESITILKDASSTSIYGSKAANGVVLITTKKGRKDMKPVITASYYTTQTSAITPKVLNASQYKTLLTEAAQNDYNERDAADDYISPELNTIVNTPEKFFRDGNTNWIKEVTRNTLSQNAELTVQGGGAASKYFSSISFNNTPGVVKSSDYQRISGKVNLENEIGKHFRFITNVILGYTQQNIGDGAYGQALRARPDYTPYDKNGNYTDFSPVGYEGQGFQNPVALLSAVGNVEAFSILGSLSGIYDISNNLQFKSTISLNSQAYNQRNYTPSYLTVALPSNMSINGGIGGNTNSRLNNWFLENTISYNKTFGKHRVNMLAGTSYETNKTSFFSATAFGYPNDDVLNNLSSAIAPLFVTGDDPSKPQSYLLSFYLRANYSFMDKYLVTITGRSDGSSKFGAANRFGYFPSGALAWRLSKENFLKNVGWINDIKLRGSYGVTGTQNIGDQMTRTLYNPFSYGGSSALIPVQLGNADIKWESTKESDAGLDISIFDDRLQATFDYYNKQTSGALLALPVSPSSTYGSLLRNGVGIKNSGLEMALSGDIIRSKNFKWSSSVNVTWNKSLVTKLDKDADLGQLGNLTGLEIGNTTLVEGKPLGLVTGLTVTGIIKTKDQLDAYKNLLGYNAGIFPYLNVGDPMYQLDETGPTDNYLNFNTIIAQAAPKYFGGITQGFSYKNLSLQFYFTFSHGGKLLWGDHISSVQFSGTSNAGISMLDRYTTTNNNTGQPRLLLNDGFYYKSNLDVFNSSYIKLRTLTFNYNLSNVKWMQRAGLKNVSVFASAANLFTITKYPGVDPETSNDPYSAAGGYLDVSNYPNVRSVSIGLKAGF